MKLLTTLIFLTLSASCTYAQLFKGGVRYGRGVATEVFDVRSEMFDSGDNIVKRDGLYFSSGDTSVFIVPSGSMSNSFQVGGFLRFNDFGNSFTSQYPVPIPYAQIDLLYSRTDTRIAETLSVGGSAVSNNRIMTFERMEMPVVMGFSFMRMHAFGGVQHGFMFRRTLELPNASPRLRSYYIGPVFGVGVDIWRFYFEARYERVDYKVKGYEWQGEEIRLDRKNEFGKLRTLQFTFSVGMKIYH